MADYDITIADNISAGIQKKITGIGTAAKSTFTAVEKLKKVLASLSSADAAFSKTVSSAQKLTTAVNKTNSAVGALRGNVTQLNTGLNRTATSATQVARNLALAGNAAARSRTQFAGMSVATRQLATLFVAGFGVRAFIQAADAAQVLQNKVLSLSTSLEQYNRIQSNLFELAIRTRTGIEATTDAYVRYSKVLIPLGKTEEEVFRFTETLSKAFRVSGKTASEASAGIIQLGQALQSGRLQGDEFRSVMENMPFEVIQALAKELGVGVEMLKRLSSQGKITADVIFEAISGLTEQIDAKFSQTTATIGDALTNLQTRFIQFMSENSAAGNILVFVLTGIADNLNILVPLVIAFGAAWAIVQLANVARDVFLLASAFVAFLPTLIPIIVAMAQFAIGFVVATAAALALAEIIAFLTGRGEEFNKWLADTAVGIGEFVTKLTTVGQKEVDFDKLASAATGAGSAFKAAAGNADELGSSASSAASEASNAMSQITSSVNATNTAVVRLGSSFNYTAQNAKRLYDALAKGNYNPGNYNPKNIATGEDSSFRTVSRPKVPSFAKGADFMVGGQAGVDKNRVSFNASRGERVKVETKRQQRQNAGGNSDNSRTVIMQVYTADANSFRRSRKQVGADLAAVLG